MPVPPRRNVRQTYLLIPAMPTPNGRFHLGHIAGPLLRCDVAARYLRSRGHRAVMMMGTDIYEAHVPLQAEKQGISPAALVHSNCLLMQKDLLSFNIDYDVWVNPLLEPGRSLYEQHHRGLLQRLIDCGVAGRVTRRAPYSSTRRGFVPRSYISGRCPSCSGSATGGVCEACGRQFAVDEFAAPILKTLDARPAAPGDLQWRQVQTLQFELPAADPRRLDCLTEIESFGLPPRYRDIAINHLIDENGVAELTTPGTWGLRWPARDGIDQIIYNYCTIYPYSLAMGELYGQYTRTGENPFTVGTDVITVCTFGVDATVCCVTYNTVFSHFETPNDRPRAFTGYDHYWGNELLQLEGAKFSTSRNHAIWAADLIETTPVTSDVARFYLATIDPAESQTTFTLAGLVHTMNNVVLEQLYRPTQQRLSQLTAVQPSPPSTTMRTRLELLMSAQDACLGSDQFRMDRAARTVTDWLTGECETDDTYWFLKGLALVAYPIMPEFGQQLWQRLGGHGTPDLDTFWTPTAATPKPSTCIPKPIRIENLNPCLPDTLKNPAAVEHSTQL